MSHPRQNVNVPDPEIGVGQYQDQYLPQLAQNQASHGVSNFADGSGHIFSMYLEMATEEDKKMVEDWKADADGILIFTGLFSAAVASLISVSIQGIQQNPQDTSNFYLANIYQAIADPNSSNISSSPPASPPPFSPPNHAVWVNALWFLSLVISLTCALLATLLQQWARRYLKITQSRYSPHKRARIRAFFAEGVEKCLLPWAVDALPTLLHISLFLFFAGLVVFLSNVNLTIFKLVLSWVGVCTALYGCITCMPIIRHDSPYYTPLSLLTWHFVTGIPFLVYRFLRWFNRSVRYRGCTFRRFQSLENSCRKSLMQGMQKTVEETALSSPSEIDTRAFMWTFDCLDEDHELEHFFTGLPGFRGSNVVDDPLPSLTEEDKLKLSEGLRGLLDRTFSSDLLSVPVKNRRALISAKAIDPEHMPNAFILHAILFKYQYSGPVATAIAKILRECGNNMDESNILRTQFAISKIIATRQPFDNSWYTLASNELGLSETSLQDYAVQGDDLSLVISIYVIRQQFIHFRKPSWQRYSFSFVLAKASKFNVQDTSLKLQHEFCTLWNEIVHEAQGGDDRFMAFLILGPIRNVFLALHQDTDSAPIWFSTSTSDENDILLHPSSYPVCKVLDHRADLTAHIHDNHASTTLVHAIPPDHNNTVFVPSFPRPDPPSSSTGTRFLVNKTFNDVQPLDNQISVTASQVIGQTTTEVCHVPTISLSPVTRCVMHESMDLSRTMQPSTSSPPPKPNASASPPDDIAIGLTALGAPPGDLNVQSSLSTQVVDVIFPTESRSPILAAAAEEEGSAKAGLSMEDDASHTTLTIRKVITANPDISPQLSSPPPITDVVIDGPSTRSLVEHIEYRPLDPTHSPYDNV